MGLWKQNARRITRSYEGCGPALRNLAGTFLLILLGIQHGQCTSLNNAKNLAGSINDFAFKVYKVLPRTENIVFSPFSLYSALTSTYLGARGRTAEEMRVVLGVPQDTNALAGLLELSNSLKKDNKLTLENANKIYVGDNCSISSKFRTATENLFGMETENVDFRKPREAAKLMNEWVERKTNSRIKELITEDKLTGDPAFVLLNAIYFLGTWKFQFMKRMHTKDFFVSRDVTVSVPMMFNGGSISYRYTRSEQLEAKIVKLPYQGEKLSMLIILPEDVEGINKVIDSLDANTLKLANEALKDEKLQIYLPKFKFEKMFEFKETLAAIGMPSAFSEADFSGVCPTATDIDTVIQKVFVEVNEKGTEAAASTGVVSSRRCATCGQTGSKFLADHPFVFVIQEEETGTVLFVGSVANPTIE